MSSTWGSNLKISIFGESHSKAIGIVIDGIPAGTVIDREQLLAFLARRSSRGGKLDPAHRSGPAAAAQRDASRPTGPEPSGRLRHTCLCND